MGDSNARQRRKEQNRRAQANLRRKRQQQIESLEQEITWLKVQANMLQSKALLPVYDAQGVSAPDAMCSELVVDHDLFNFPDVEVQVLAGDPFLGQDVPQESSLPSLSTSSHHMYTTAPVLSNRPSTTQPYDNDQATSQTFSALVPSPFDCLAHNAAILDITPEGFLSTHSTSPFYQPFKTRNFLLATIASLPPNLHPTVAQLSYPHQAWIDCVPQPDLRSRIIFGTCHNPPLLDCLDLWHDLMAGGDVRVGDACDASDWKVSTHFSERWQMLLKLDLRNLQKMCVASNPPLLLTSLSGE